MSKKDEDFWDNLGLIIRWILITINPYKHYKNLKNPELSTKNKIKSLIPTILILFCFFYVRSCFNNIGDEQELRDKQRAEERLKEEKELLKLKTLSGAFDYITSDKRKYKTDVGDQTDLIKFFKDSTYVQTRIDKRSEEIVKETKGTFTLGKSKIIDDLTPFMYVKYKTYNKSDWGYRDRNYLRMTDGYQLFIWKPNTRNLDYILLKGMDSPAYDEYGPRITGINLLKYYNTYYEIIENE
ncbi:hypothetical protein N9743_01615 [Flavobacteriaceae bacterium]|nr:hypothetical protein [Flavobacteriaceae bacterium]